MKLKIPFFSRSLFVILFLANTSLYAQNWDRDLFFNAEARFKVGNISLALKQFDELLEKWPDSPYNGDARYYRAVILYRMGNNQEAYQAFEVIEKRYHFSRYIHYIPFWKALIDYDAKNYVRALQLLSNLDLNKLDDETQQQALLYKGKAALALDNTDLALKAFECLNAERFRKSLRVETEGTLLVYLSEMYGRLGKYDEQIKLWESLPAEGLNPEIRESLALRTAEAYLVQGKIDKGTVLLDMLSVSSNREIAIKALQYLLRFEQRQGHDDKVASIIVRSENLLRSDPKALAMFWFQVGSSTFYEGKLDLAKSYFLRVLAIAENENVTQDVPIYLAEISWRQGDKKQAMQILSDAIPRLNDKKALLLSRLQWYALQQEDWHDAIRFGEQALIHAEKEGREDISALVRAYSSYALYREHEYTQALLILGTDPIPPGPKELSLRLQSRLFQKTGQVVSALDSYNALIQQNPFNPEIQIERMSLLFEKSQYDQVIASSKEIEGKFDVAKITSPYRFGFLYMKGVSLAITSSTAAVYSAAAEVLIKALENGPPGDIAFPWALYYKGWSLYRASRFIEAAETFEQFARQYPDHPQTYPAAYLGAWSYARQGLYEKSAILAQRAAAFAGASDPLAKARARYLEGVVRSFTSDWTGALKALDLAASFASPLAVRALFEKGNVYYRMGKIQEADTVFATVQRNYSQEPQAEEAAYRRGELYYEAKQWREALERFTQYRQTYIRGNKVDGALYFSASIQRELSQIDSAILLWERLIREYQRSTYRLPAMIALEKAYWMKQDWENALRVGTNAIVEFGDAAKSAGLEDDVATLRYLLVGMNEKAARLQVKLIKQQGVTSMAGRKTALELARYYIVESSQREAGLALVDQVLAYVGEDPGSAAEAHFLKGEYYALLEAWEKSTDAYLDAINLAIRLKAGETRQDLIPEALFKAVRNSQRLGKTESAKRLVETLKKQYGTSPWAKQADLLMEASR
ncbi:tetratricopeptide repeat protein [Gracilinema caldarium]|uniref:Tetratricopeptide TPR_1 repeat-containing protein n=1 Tax=Gracilinema caldarium (strain ATCC 51460 / DSM 7334 / H1) TaxID=744872 RepID=F8F0V5_GRAC1|nr:tetratricopeptide repeat protein [Gracilinema caldarium]AEJ20241.1 Tetratricopeptide TPR_1 repeat-containing protein [Gracilinema caldarium DSM 7334]